MVRVVVVRQQALDRRRTFKQSHGKNLKTKAEQHKTTIFRCTIETVFLYESNACTLTEFIKRKLDAALKEILRQ